MGIHKKDVVLDCNNCVFAESLEDQCFAVDVPVVDIKNNTSVSVRLHCKVTPDAHEVHLLESEQNLEERLSAALDNIAEHRVCGNCNVCPREVVDIVDHYAHSPKIKLSALA